MTWFVRVAGVYNASAVVVLVTPGALELVGVPDPYSAFWTWLPGLTGLFAGIVLLLSSMNMRLFAAFPYWNGIIRLVFVVATVWMSFGSMRRSSRSSPWGTCRSRSARSSDCRGRSAGRTGSC